MVNVRLKKGFDRGDESFQVVCDVGRKKSSLLPLDVCVVALPTAVSDY